jgi:hypothetical protein
MQRLGPDSGRALAAYVAARAFGTRKNKAFLMLLPCSQNPPNRWRLPVGQIRKSDNKNEAENILKTKGWNTTLL